MSGKALLIWSLLLLEGCAAHRVKCTLNPGEACTYYPRPRAMTCQTHDPDGRWTWIVRVCE